MQNNPATPELPSTTLPAYERVLAAFRSEGLAVVDNGRGKAQAQAPGHSPADRSVSVTGIAGQVLIHSHSDPTEEVLAALGLTAADLFDDKRGTVYDYPDGRQVFRSVDKKFRQTGNTKGDSLFHVDRVGKAETVYYVEGEKDVLAAESVGTVAVCNAGGAGKAHLFDLTPLHGKTVVIVADKDGPGRKHAQQVADQLDGKAAWTIVEAAVGKDAADHIAAGKTVSEFVSQRAPGADDTERTPRLWNAADLRATEQPRWLAKGRLPRAAISLLVGDEGIGKSLLWVWLVAAITTGRPLPEFGIPARQAGRVILVLTEDDWSTTVLPRLQVADADLTNVSVICTDDDGSGAPIFPRDLYLITDAEPKPAAVVVDAWLDTVASNLSVRDPQQARRALHPWKEVATITEAAVLLLTHTNRVDSGNARDKYGATGELRKKARLTLFAQQDDDGNLVVGPEKANTTGSIAASTFQIDPISHFDPTDEHDGTVPLLRYIGESDRTAREHITDNHDNGGEGGDVSRSDAESWLKGYLDRNGPEADSARAKAAARSGGISERTLQRARKKLGVVIGYTDKGTSTWSLPSQGAVVEGEVVPTPVPPTTDNLFGGTSPKSGTSAGHRPVPTPVPQQPTRAYANPNQQAQDGTSPRRPRPASCPGCFITLPTTATGELCEDCAEGGHSFLQHPEPNPRPEPTVVHNGLSEKKERNRIGVWLGSGQPINGLTA